MTTRHLAICVDGLGDNWLGGVNYFRNLLSVFDAAQASDLRLHLLTDDAGFLDGLNLSPRVQVHRLPMLRRKSPAWALRKAAQVALGRDALLIAQLKRLQVSAVVFSHVAGAAGAGIRCLPWIPDFQFKHHPDLFPPAVVAAEQLRAEKYAGLADGLIVSSQAAAEDAVALFGANRSRVHVLHFAPRMDFEPLCAAALRDTVLTRHGIDRPYVFLPNQYWQHKNHGLVLKALRQLQQAGQPAPLVVSTGKTEDMRDPAYFGRFESDLRAQGLQGAYRILGVIARQDMLVLLAHCMVLLNPSRFEGWSTTVEEAKALGKPLLVSDIAVHREQLAGRADTQSFGTDDAAALASLLSSWQERQGQSRVTDHPPRPDPGLYATFASQYIGLLREVSGTQKTPA